MWKQGCSSSSALDRAMAQLAAKRLPNAGGASQINENVLHQKNTSSVKGLIPRQIDLQDLSDISSECYSEVHDYGVAPIKTLTDNDISEKNVGGGSRFLKKKSNTITDRLSSAPSSQRLSVEEASWIPQRRSQSAALSRLTQFEERFRHRKQGNYAQPSSPGPPSPQEPPLSTHSSSDLSVKGARFLKKNVTSSLERSEKKHAPQISVKGSRVASNGVSFDSDEEDMKRLLGSSFNSLAESSGPTNKFYKENTMKTLRNVQDTDTFNQRVPKPPTSEQASPIHTLNSVSIVYSPTPSTPNIHSPSRRSPKIRFLQPSQSQSSASVNNEIRSLEELFTDTDNDTISERSEASGGFKLNVMTLDDLIPAEPVVSKIQVGVASRRDSADEDASEHTLDDIFPEDKEEEAAVQYESDFESDVKSEATDQSVSEIPEHLTDDEKSEAVDQSEEPSHHQHLPEMGKHSHAEQSETDSGRSFEAHDRKSQETFSRSYSSYSGSDTLTRTNVPHRNHVKEAAVQTEKGEAYTVTSGLDALASTYMDPTPVAQYTVNPETLEAMASQKPFKAALNDMLKQQLALTRHFIESSRHLYGSLLQSLEMPDYQYTTLEDTKEYIRKHRPPKLTLEEALEEVQREMRDYHYL